MGTILILLKLLSAHIIADFFLQFDRLCQGKQEKGVNGIIAQAIHALIHAICAYLLLADWTQWLIPVVILITHFIIDTIKIKWQGNNTLGFLVDQLVHVAIIILLWWCIYADPSFVMEGLINPLQSIKFWAVLIGYMLVLKPSSLLIGMFIRGWTPSNMQSFGMPSAGRWIGYIERVLIVTFVLTNNISAVGFLMATKSIFRFGDLNKAREIKITEYVLLGTLASFTIALLVGFAINAIINN